MSEEKSYLEEAERIKRKYEELKSVKDSVEKKSFYLVKKKEDIEKKIAEILENLRGMGIDTDGDIKAQIMDVREKAKKEFADFSARIENNKKLVEEAEQKIKESGL